MVDDNGLEYIMEPPGKDPAVCHLGSLSPGWCSPALRVDDNGLEYIMEPPGPYPAGDSPPDCRI